MNRRNLYTYALFFAACVLGACPLWGQQDAPPAAATSSNTAHSAIPGWIHFSGELRSRMEGVTGNGFKPNADDLYMLTRVLIGMRIQAKPWLKFMVQGQDAHVFWKNQHPAAPPYQDTFDLRQGYVELGDTEKMTFGLRVGRQELNYGDKRLVGRSHWANASHSFDAIRGTFRHNGFRLDAFAASVVKIRDLQFNESTPGNYIYGLYAGTRKLVPQATFEPYFFWRRSSGLLTETGTPGTLNFGTYGFRWVGKLPAHFDYGTEMARQAGSLGTDTIDAWAGHWLVGYTASRARFTPHFYVEFDYATGDHNPTDGHRGTFDQLYAVNHDKFGLSDEVGWRNIEHLGGGIQFKVKSNWQLAVKHNVWWLADSHDALYNASGNAVARVPSGAAGRFVGQESEIVTTYTFPHQVETSAGFGHIFPGTFLLNATPGVSHNFTYTQLMYTF